ncbi:type II toxin-antitoxin system HigA family antitoxin [Pseudomonas sp. NPDC089407]|uniref:helix-turn-helix domain-containing protein n=1 Tax=Pseudomonas sp. NPDC089407 TaxID=3364464 RepID=UPI00384F754E
MANLISDFDKKHFPTPDATGVEVLRSLMEEHGVSQRDLPEIGSQSTVAQLLSGKRKLNICQIRALADRFCVNPNVFLG